MIDDTPVNDDEILGIEFVEAEEAPSTPTEPPPAPPE